MAPEVLILSSMIFGRVVKEMVSIGGHDFWKKMIFANHFASSHFASSCGTRILLTHMVHVDERKCKLGSLLAVIRLQGNRHGWNCKNS